mmetsp:Transcript_13540/g.44763  ORF Transcript_13540/g.44763 Transcript_13540/m.44763 type:complete len:276 (+) Transcript_13540:100-927(+)
MATKFPCALTTAVTSAVVNDPAAPAAYNEITKSLLTPAPPESSGVTSNSSVPATASPFMKLARVTPVRGGVRVGSGSGAFPEKWPIASSANNAAGAASNTRCAVIETVTAWLAFRVIVASAGVVPALAVIDTTLLTSTTRPLCETIRVADPSLFKTKSAPALTETVTPPSAPTTIRSVGDPSAAEFCWSLTTPAFEAPPPINVTPPDPGDPSDWPVTVTVSEAAKEIPPLVPELVKAIPASSFPVAAMDTAFAVVTKSVSSINECPVSFPRNTYP